MFIRKNIGLIGGVPIVPEEITLDQALDVTPKIGLFQQMFRGAKDGALSGLETGQFFCWSGSRHSGRSFHFSGNLGGTDALIVLILCGGGMVTGMGIGATVGMVTPFMFSNDTSEILIARQHVIQGVWKELTQLPNLENSITKKENSKKVTFGIRTQPFSSFMRLEHIQVGLFPRSYFDDDVLTLVWDIHVGFFDHRRQMLASQNIEIEQGEYSFEKWADQEANFLKTKLREGYGLIAAQIVEKLSTK